MKIYKHDYIFFIRLSFKRRGDKALYLPLVETTLDETEAMIKSALNEVKTGLFEQQKGYTTTIEMREATGGKNGKYRQMSFKGLSPSETRSLLIEYINKLNQNS
jgi:hypothetical protein